MLDGLDRLATLVIGPESSESREPAVAGARRFAIAALLLSVALQFGFVALNLEANDNHLEVSQVMAYQGIIPMVTS